MSLLIIRSSIEDPRQINVKRVIGLPGDKVSHLTSSMIQFQDYHQITTRGLKPGREVVIPEGRIWIEGDESFRSRDSNAYGPVPMGCVHGKVVGILWPFSRFGRLDDRGKKHGQ
jgi:signal peptidase I